MPNSDERDLLSPGDIRGPALQRAFEAVPTGLVIADPSGAIQFVNSAAEGMLLYERSQLLGQQVQALLPPAHHAAFSARVAACLEAPTQLSTGERVALLRRDGSELLAEMILNPLATSEGAWVLVSMVDLTAQKRLEVTAQEQHERLQACWEATSEGLITVDASGTIEMVNNAMERIFGYDRSELVGQPIETIIPEEHRGSHVEKRDKYFAEPRLRPMGKGLELSGRRKDGTLFPVDVGLNVARIGERTIAIGFVSDISEKKRLQEQSAVLGTLVDLQQRLGTARRGEAAASEFDPLTGLDTRTAFQPALEKASTDLQGLHVVVYSVQRMEQMSARLGTTTADRVIVFVSQYIANTLHEGDLLFRWNSATFVSLVRRDSNVLHREVADACGKRLEYFVEHSGADSLLMIALSLKILPLAPVKLAEVAAEIERFSLTVV